MTDKGDDGWKPLSPNPIGFSIVYVLAFSIPIGIFFFILWRGGGDSFGIYLMLLFATIICVCPLAVMVWLVDESDRYFWKTFDDPFKELAYGMMDALAAHGLRFYPVLGLANGEPTIISDEGSGNGKPNDALPVDPVIEGGVYVHVHELYTFGGLIFHSVGPLVSVGPYRKGHENLLDVLRLRLGEKGTSLER